MTMENNKQNQNKIFWKIILKWRFVFVLLFEKGKVMLLTFSLLYKTPSNRQLHFQSEQ